MKTLIEQLEYSKIKMNWNKNPIPMDKFKSFLTVGLVKPDEFMGKSTGWTEYRNDEVKLVVRGGFVNTRNGLVDYLDTIQYKKNLHNKYNDYCSPFNLFDIMNDEGKKFFIDYYKDEIDKILETHKQKISILYNQYKEAQEHWLKMENELDDLTPYPNKP